MRVKASTLYIPSNLKQIRNSEYKFQGLSKEHQYPWLVIVYLSMNSMNVVVSTIHRFVCHFREGW